MKKAMGNAQDRAAAHAVPLRGSRSVTVRAVRPDDKDEFESAFAHLSPNARYIVLPDNTGMRGLAARLGFTDTAWPEDRSLRLVSLTLD